MTSTKPPCPLREAREGAAVQRLALAAVAGVSVDTVRRLESGEPSRFPGWAAKAYGAWLPDPGGAYLAWRQQLAAPLSPEANPLGEKVEQLQQQLKAQESAAKAERLALQSELKDWRRVAGTPGPAALAARLVALESKALAPAPDPRWGVIQVSDLLDLFLTGESFAILPGVDAEASRDELEKVRKAILAREPNRKNVRQLVELLNRLVEAPDQFEKVLQTNIHQAIRHDFTWRRAKHGKCRLVFGHRPGQVCILAFGGRDHVYDEMRGLQTGPILTLKGSVGT